MGIIRNMNYLENKILTEGKIINDDILKVDSFLNHQIDPKTIRETAKLIVNVFPKADKILTIETSGIVIAYAVAELLGDIPVVFAKKSKSAINDCSNVYMTEIKSFTRNTVSTVTVDKRFINRGEKILIVDDFLAEGNAAIGLINLVKQGEAKVVGVSAAIEKFFQGGHEKIEKIGIPVYCPASIKSFKDNKPFFNSQK